MFIRTLNGKALIYWRWKGVDLADLRLSHLINRQREMTEKIFNNSSSGGKNEKSHKESEKRI